MRSDAWNVQRIELLRTLWSEGQTAAAIAARLGGISRSAVLGKVFRLRLRTDDAAKQAKSKSAGRRRDNTVAPLTRRRRSGERQLQTRQTSSPGTLRKTLLELTNNTCRWPHGRPGTERFFFCGVPDADLEHGIPYCARHMRRAYGASPGLASVESGASAESRPSSMASAGFKR